MSSKNGVRAKALALRPPYGPQEVAILLDARTGVYLGLAANDTERSVITEQVARGWEERPALSEFIGLLSRRVVSEDDREILRRADSFRRLLPEAARETKPDPVLEQLIIGRIAKKVQAEVIAGARLNEVVAVQVEMRKAKSPAELATLQAKALAAADERKHALHALDHEISRLTDLLQQRANHRRMAVLAASTS